MEGKVIKEESVGSPCSPAAPLPLVSNLPSGKENRRLTSPPLNTSEILTRSRSKVLSKENSHYPHSHRMSESPKAVTSGTSSSSGRQSPGSNMPVVKSSSSPAHPSHGSSSSFPHSFSSPHSTSSTPTASVGNNGTTSGRGGRTPSPSPVNGNSANAANNSGSSGSGRTPSSSSNSSGSASSREGLSILSGASSGRHIIKVKRFLGTLLHFGCDISPEVGDRVRSLVFNLVSGHLSVEDFHHSLQEVTSFPLRPFVLPFLRAHLPILQREISHLARISKQSPLSFIRTNEQVITEAGSSPGEPCDIFHSEATDRDRDLGISGKRKATSDSFYENSDGNSVEHSSPAYTSTPKRHHASMFSPSFFISGGGNGVGGPGGELREYYGSSYPLLVAAAAAAAATHHGHSHHPTEGGSGGQSTNPTTNGIGGGSSKGPAAEDEWKNIHVMLNCILSMVEKTKRALSILQNRTMHHGGDGESGGGGGGDRATVSAGAAWLRRPTYAAVSVDNSEDFKRQAGEMMAQALRATEDRVAEVKRRAEEAVQEVKRQALVELQRAVAAAEARACETVASERARLERVFLETRRTPGESMLGAPVDPETCWNCGRKAHETCSGCNMARYCSAFCQHKDWEHHHNVCGRHGGSHSSSSERSGVAGTGIPNNVETKVSRGGQQDSNSSPPLNVSNPSPENLSPQSNN